MKKLLYLMLYALLMVSQTSVAMNQQTAESPHMFSYKYKQLPYSFFQTFKGPEDFSNYRAKTEPVRIAAEAMIQKFCKDTESVWCMNAEEVLAWRDFMDIASDQPQKNK